MLVPRSQVWSISYGFPEAWTCYAEPGVCDNETGAPHGYDPSVYLHRANNELKKLVALGVSELTKTHIVTREYISMWYRLNMFLKTERLPVRDITTVEMDVLKPFP